jgi:hypothetical protein
MKLAVPPRIEFAQKRSSALVRREAAVKALTKTEDTYRSALTRCDNQSLELKRAYAALVAAAVELRQSIQAASSYAEDVDSWRLGFVANIERPVCSCGCGAPLPLFGRGRPREFATASCRMRAMRRRLSNLPKATPRLRSGGRMTLEVRLRDPWHWEPARQPSRFQSEVLAQFWAWWLGDSRKPQWLPLPTTLDRLTETFRARLAVEDPDDLKSFISMSAGRSVRSARTHLLFVERRRNRIQTESGCGRTWTGAAVATVSDIDRIDCVLCRERVIRMSR